MTNAVAENLTPKGRAMRERLMKAGIEVFGELGYEPVRVTDITAHCKTAHGSFYRYFNSKDDLLYALLVPIVDEVFRATGSTREAQDDSGDWLSEPSEERIVEQVHRHFRIHAKHRRMLDVCRQAAYAAPHSEFFELWYGQRDRFVARNMRWIQRLQDEGRISTEFNPEYLAKSMGGMIEQVAYSSISLAKTLPSDEDLRALAFNAIVPWFRGVIRSPG